MSGSNIRYIERERNNWLKEAMTIAIFFSINSYLI